MKAAVVMQIPAVTVPSQIVSERSRCQHGVIWLQYPTISPRESSITTFSYG